MTLRSVSATQIKQHRSCALQWYLQRVEGWTMPQSPSQALGEAIHKQVEDYLLEGKNPDLPSVENAMKKGYVPLTGGAYLVEEPKDYGMRMLAAGVPVKGRIDLLVPPAAGERLVKVVDWKSASSFRYVPEPDVLTRDVQGVLYLKYAFENYPYATEGQFRHVYLLTKGIGSKKVDAEVVDRPFVDAQWAHIEQTVEEMKATATRSLPVVAQTQANLSHCSNYGGCSFRDRCPAASKGLVASILEAESQESAPLEGITMSTLAEKLKARKAATQSSPVATPAPQPVVEPVVVEPVVEAKTYVPGPIGIIPPDAPGGDKVPEKAEGVVLPERSEGIMATLAKRRATKAQPTEAKVEVQPTPVVVEPTPEPVVTEPVKVEYVNVLPVVAPAAVLQPVEPVVEKPTSAELTLFVDCFPEKAPFDTLRALEDEIAARTPSLLEHLRKTSPKDVPEGTMDLGEVLFGRGYSTLSASFAVKPISGAWTVSTLGPASSKVLEVLLPKATFVVRGRR
jgi:CRISPR/Cas system-associated exonuclease Cas4 (RecB family)